MVTNKILVVSRPKLRVWKSVFRMELKGDEEGFYWKN